MSKKEDDLFLTSLFEDEVPVKKKQKIRKAPKYPIQKMTNERRKGPWGTWDYSKMDDAELDHEVHLSYESLYGHTYNGEIVLSGLLMDKDRIINLYGEERYKESLRIWQGRHEQASSAMLERKLQLASD